jgi:hypothetical protein
VSRLRRERSTRHGECPQHLHAGYIRPQIVASNIVAWWLMRCVRRFGSRSDEESQQEAEEEQEGGDDAMAGAPSTPRTPVVALASSACEDDCLDGVSAATVAAVRAREAMLLAAKTPESVMAKERAKTMGKLRTVFDTLQVPTTTLVSTAASDMQFVSSIPSTYSPSVFHLGRAWCVTR